MEKKLLILLFAILFLNIVYGKDKKEHWETVADSVLIHAYDKEGCPPDEVDFVRNFVKMAIENRRFDDSTRLFGDPIIPDNVWLEAFEFEYSAKLQSIKGQFLHRYTILDTENIRISYPFKVYISYEDNRPANYTENTPVKYITCPDTSKSGFAGWLFPLWYKDITVGMCKISAPSNLENCNFNTWEAKKDEDCDYFSELRTAWPLSKGYNPVIVIVLKNVTPYDYYFNIPQVDSKNLTPLHIGSRNITPEESSRKNVIKEMCKNQPQKIPVLGYKGRFKKLSTVYEEMINLK